MRYTLTITTPECDVIDVGETVADSQEHARNIAWERYQHLVQAGHVAGAKRDRCNVEARPVVADAMRGAA